MLLLLAGTEPCKALALEARLRRLQVLSLSQGTALRVAAEQASGFALLSITCHCTYKSHTLNLSCSVLYVAICCA